MRYRSWGQPGWRVSELALGTWNQVTDAVTFHAVLDAAAEAGIDLVDTADSYADGAHEQHLGAWLASRRTGMRVATKTFFPVGAADPGGLAPARLDRALAASERRLGLQRIDLYQLHRHDPAIPVEAIVTAIARFLAAGRIAAWGLCRWPAAEAIAAERLAAQAGIAPPVTHQYHYNLFSRTLDEPGTVHTSRDMRALAYSPLAQGVLTGKYAADAPAGSRATQPAGRASMWDLQGAKVAQAQTWSARCRAQGVTLAQVALAWCLQRQEVGAVLTGASRPEQLRDNLGYVRVAADPELLARILA